MRMIDHLSFDLPRLRHAGSGLCGSAAHPADGDRKQHFAGRLRPAHKQGLLSLGAFQARRRA
jgi:hypothetical protein